MKDKGNRALMVSGGIAAMLGVGLGMTERKGIIPGGGVVSCGSPWAPNDHGLVRISAAVPRACAEALASWGWFAGVVLAVGVFAFFVGAYGALVAVPVRND